MADMSLDEQERAEMLDPSVGDGSPDTAPWRDTDVALVDREPIRVLGVAQSIAAAAAVIVGLGAPWWAGLALAVALYAVDEVKRSKVTPTAMPKIL